MNTGSLACQSAAWHRTENWLSCMSAAWHRIEHWLSCMSVSCLTPHWKLALLHASQLPTPYWTLALLYASQLPDTVLKTDSLLCQSAAWHRTEQWLSCMPVSCLTPYWTLALLYVSQLPDSVNQPRLPCMSVSCLILWMKPGSLACQSLAWPCERTLAPLHVSQLSDPLHWRWIPCMSDSCLILWQPWLSCMLVSCLTLWMNPGSLACQSVAWPCEWTLALLHISHSTSQTILGGMRTNTTRHESNERENKPK